MSDTAPAPGTSASGLAGVWNAPVTVDSLQVGN